MSTNPNNLVLIRSVIPSKYRPNRRELLWLAEEKKCHWCGRSTRLVSEDAADQATIDHVIPRYKGGTNEVSNLVSSCRGCNARRNTEDMKGLVDGSLLGNHNYAGKPDYNRRKPNIYQHIALTGDEKKALLARVQATPVDHVKDKHKTEDVLREQRDQAQKEILNLRRELKQWEATVTSQREEIDVLKSLTLWKFIRKRLSERIAP